MGNYQRLALVLSINTVLMFFITYANLWSIDHFNPNLNRIYMALLMTAPMGIVMMLVMRSMYGDRTLTIAFLSGFAVLLVASFVLMRTQVPVGNEQFLRSMIPHHSSAILVCERSDITDPEIMQLCDEIVEAQLEEIAQMKTILERY